MTSGVCLTSDQFQSLKEIAHGPMHGPIPEDHAELLLRLGYAYLLLGEIRITRRGRERVMCGQ
jgi:hypothetical protein